MGIAGRSHLIWSACNRRRGWLEVEGPMTQSGTIGVCGVCAYLVVAGAAIASEEPIKSTDLVEDCGIISLYFMFRFEGRLIETSRIATALNEVASVASSTKLTRGRSMKDLRDGAGRLGLDLDGVRWPRGGPSPDRSVIAFLDRKPHGHFIAVRPVGHSGNLVQVFDNDLPPEIIDATRLTASREWTGLILMPHRPK